MLAVNEIRKCQNWQDYCQLASDWQELKDSFFVLYLETWVAVATLVDNGILSAEKDLPTIRKIFNLFARKNADCVLKYEKENFTHPSWEVFRKSLKMTNAELMI